MGGWGLVGGGEVGGGGEGARGVGLRRWRGKRYSEIALETEGLLLI